MSTCSCVGVRVCVYACATLILCVSLFAVYLFRALVFSYIVPNWTTPSVGLCGLLFFSSTHLTFAGLGGFFVYSTPLLYRGEGVAWDTECRCRTPARSLLAFFFSPPHPASRRTSPCGRTMVFLPLFFLVLFSGDIAVRRDRGTIDLSFLSPVEAGFLYYLSRLGLVFIFFERGPQ